MVKAWLGAASAFVRLLHAVGKREHYFVQASHAVVRRRHVTGTSIHADVRSLIEPVQVKARQWWPGSLRAANAAYQDVRLDAAPVVQPAAVSSGGPTTMEIAHQTP